MSLKSGGDGQVEASELEDERLGRVDRRRVRGLGGGGFRDKRMLLERRLMMVMIGWSPTWRVERARHWSQEG